MCWQMLTASLLRSIICDCSGFHHIPIDFLFFFPPHTNYYFTSITEMTLEHNSPSPPTACSGIDNQPSKSSASLLREASQCSSREGSGIPVQALLHFTALTRLSCHPSQGNLEVIGFIKLLNPSTEKHVPSISEQI